MKKNCFIARLISIFVLLCGLSFTGSAFATEKYRVITQVFNFGELIAKPMMEVEEGKTTAGTYSVPGQAQYKIIVLVKPAAKDSVFVSLQFSSGKINVQPNLLVDLGKEKSVTVDKVRLNLLVQRMTEKPAGNQAVAGLPGA